MKALLYIIAILFAGSISAQVNDGKDAVKPDDARFKKDSLSPEMQIQKQTDLKTSDAVKTDHHPKIAPAVTDSLTKGKKSKRKPACKKQ